MPALEKFTTAASGWGLSELITFMNYQGVPSDNTLGHCINESTEKWIYLCYCF